MLLTREAMAIRILAYHLLVQELRPVLTTGSMCRSLQIPAALSEFLLERMASSVFDLRSALCLMRVFCSKAQTLTPLAITRSPYTLQEFGKAWFAGQEQLVNNHTSFPKRIVVPSNLWSVTNNASKAVFDDWISKLSTFLNASVETTSISEFWNATANKPGTDFASYMQMVGFNLIWKNQLDNVITPSREDYAAANGGRTPFINPFPAARYRTAENITDAEVDEAYEKFQFFKEWFGREVVKSDPECCSESLWLIPMATGDVVSDLYIASNGHNTNTA